MSCIRSFRYGIVLSVLLLVFVSCFGDKSVKKIKAGIVDFNISWNVSRSSKINGMPKSVKLLYSDQGYCLEFEKIFSFIGMRVVQEFNKDSVNCVLDMAGMGSYFEYPINTLRTNLDKLSCEKLKETKTILNYECSAVQYVSKSSNAIIKIFYTKKLDIDVVNRVVPKLKVDGAILGLHINKGSDEICLEATSISVKDVDSSLFVVPNDFLKNSYEQIATTLDNLVQ